MLPAKNCDFGERNILSEFGAFAWVQTKDLGNELELTVRLKASTVARPMRMWVEIIG